MPKPPRHKQGRYLCAPLSALIDDRLSKSERLVLLGLYSFHNHKTDSPVFPSRSALAKRSVRADKRPCSKRLDNQKAKRVYQSHRLQIAYSALCYVADVRE